MTLEAGDYGMGAVYKQAPVYDRKLLQIDRATTTEILSRSHSRVAHPNVGETCPLICTHRK